MNLQVMHNIRYAIPGLQQRTESAIMVSCQDIFNEAVGAPDHATRLRWAQWANTNSPTATLYFTWPLAMNPSVQASVGVDPSGSSVTDGDIQFVVNGALPEVINQCELNPPSNYPPVA